MRIGERIHNLKKLFNMREGWRPGDDWLPERLLSESLPTGVVQGVGLSVNELREMIGGYYQARGWDENGFIPQSKLRELEIEAPVSSLGLGFRVNSIPGTRNSKSRR
jgi:aldehyde:ferredoxin oxidoreductase